MKKRILVTRQLPESGIQRLKDERFELTLWGKERPMTDEELADQAGNHDAILSNLTDRIDAAFLAANSHLDMISQFAVGVDNIDVAAATRLNIPVGHTPGVLTESTADIAFALMIAVARKMVFMHKKIIHGEWGYFNPIGNLGIQLRGKTLGIFGLGRIGLEMSRLCKNAYGMKVIYHNRSRNKAAEDELGATRVDFPELLAQSDILSVHCNLSAETRDVFNEAAFKQMKPTAIFINTARGGVHQETDLIQALETGEIWGVGLDVTNPEPMDNNNPLLNMENVCIVPHIGSATIEARGAMSDLAAINLIEFYKTGRAPHIVNPEIFNIQ